MSTEYRLTPAALLYAAVSAGGEQFYGIPDPFSGIAEEDAERTIAEIEKELADKKLTEMDFDGNVTQDEAFSGVLSFCAACNDITGFDCRIQGKEKHITVFRGHDETAYLLEVQENECVLKEIAQEETLPYLFRTFGIGEDAPLIQTEQVYLDSVEVKTADEESLKQSGCAEPTARLIRKAFQNEGVLCFGKRLEEGEEVHAVSLLLGEEGMLSMRMYYGNDAEEICFTPVKAEEARQLIAALCA